MSYKNSHSGCSCWQSVTNARNSLSKDVVSAKQLRILVRTLSEMCRSYQFFWSQSLSKCFNLLLVAYTTDALARLTVYWKGPYYLLSNYLLFLWATYKQFIAMILALA